MTELDHSSRPDTPLASQASTSTADSTPAQDPSSATIMLPVPTHSTENGKASFAYPDNVDQNDMLGPLPPEIASADISIAVDGSFVETSSGPAARELKRRYDQHYGVGKDVRSPYAITALINQHGKQMYRVGLRDTSATDPSAADAELELPLPKPSESPDRPKRRSQMSFHVFKNGSLSRPQTMSPQHHAPRKLRKTRSIPDNIKQPNERVGRGHSQSVTAADMLSITHTLSVDAASQTSASYRKKGDMFAEVMEWASQVSTSSTNYSAHSLPHQAKELTLDEKHPLLILHPFGAGVMFDSPRPSSILEHIRLRTPRILREMQSFESGLTARQDEESRVERISAVPSLDSDDALRRPPSAIRLRESIASSARKEDAAPSPASPPIFEPSLPTPQTAILSRYSADIFNILQTYRGLPVQFDKLLSDGEETTVKMSLDDAAPKDDPRFVIWGEVQADKDDLSLSQDSYTDLSSSAHSLSLSKRRSNKGKGKAPPEIPSLKLGSGSGTDKILIAATIERWIAQLTSVLNYDELLIFFLTYRTYISSVDLGHLLICRFHWSLQTTGSVIDDRVRRIVRTRTFVAFRYWLLTFFTVDFLPNRDLRMLVANWLNTLRRDPILEKHVDGVNTVKKLIKVVKDCKKAHTRAPTRPKPRERSTTNSSKLSAGGKEEQLFGEKFAEATRKLEVEDEESDVDLDFLADETEAASSSNAAHIASIHLGNTLSPSGPNSIPPSSLSILQQTDHAPGPQPDGPPSATFVQTSATLPIHHGALSRAFVKTIGHLGRWKRVLNSRSTSVRAPLTGCTNVSAFELEPVGSDMLTVRGGVEQYLKLIENQQDKTPTIPSASLRTPHSAPPVSRSSVLVSSSPVESPLPSGSTEESTESNVTAVPLDAPPEYSDAVEQDAAAADEDEDDDEDQPDIQHSEVTVEVVDINEDRVSLARSSSTDSFGVPLSSVPAFQSPWGFEVVSIDDLDLSDTSSEAGGPSAPPGLRRPTRRLPLRRDFEFAPRPDSVSSMGIHSRDSVVSSTASSVSVALGGNIQQWQMNALVDSLTDDGEGGGDPDDALRRLEGQINPQKKQEKASKVDGWVRSIQARMAAGDYGEEKPRFSDDDDEDEDAPEEQDEDDLSRDSPSPPEIVVREADAVSFDEGSPLENASTPIPDDSVSPPRTDAKPAPEDAVPLEILQSRMPPEPVVAASPRAAPGSKYTSIDTVKVHRSFVLGNRAEVLAQHFAMIDRELFMGVKFEELVLDDWMACEEVNVLDWAQYLKDRARWKAESRYPEKTSALAAVRARFNLMANFVVSEIVLTSPGDRPIVFAKFLRIAWKSYCLQSFNTLVSIITALRSDWVSTAMRRYWNRLGMWESRIFSDLKQWCASEESFKHIRQTINALIDAKPLDASSHTPSVVSGGAAESQRNTAVNSACIPFIGVYLAQLHHHSRLPDLIDPTAPQEAVTVDPVTGSFDRPAHPEVFSTLAPLPSPMDLEPLINVHKQRMIAGVIKSLVASQHLASRVQFSVDKKLFQKCLRLRGLDNETLQRALIVYSDSH